jgi:hypothetical protein
MIVDGLQNDRIVGSDAVQFLERESAWLVGELFLRPAA